MTSWGVEDAKKISDAFQDLGGVPPHSTLMLLNRDANEVREAMIELNRRIRQDSAGDAVLIVYYSGHADANALHLGKTVLPLR